MIIAPIAQVSDDYNAAYANIQPLFWLVRTHGDPHLSIPAITEQLRIASAGFPVAHIRTMDEVMGGSTARQSFNMLLLTIFGAVALLLAAIGIYGLMAYSVAQRTQEMGIRMALGADRSAIRNLVVWQGMRLALSRHRCGHRCVLRPYSPLVHLPVRRQALGSRGVRIGVTHPHRDCSARRMVACRARLQSRSHAGVARGVVGRACEVTSRSEVPIRWLCCGGHYRGLKPMYVISKAARKSIPGSSSSSDPLILFTVQIRGVICSTDDE